MKTRRLLPMFCAVSLFGTLHGESTALPEPPPAQTPAAAAATEKTEPDLPIVPAPMTRLALFPDGIAAVERQMNPPPGDFLMTEVIKPIEGSLWFNPSAGLAVERVIRSIEAPNEAPFADLARTFAGKQITVFYKENKSITGTVVAPPDDGNQDGYLTLVREDGRHFSLPRGYIELVESASVPGTVPVKRPVLLFHPRNRAGGPLVMRYLTTGLNWVPSYRVTLGPDSKLDLEYAATITNNLEDLNDVEMTLLIGSSNFFTRNLSAMSTAFTPVRPLPKAASATANSYSRTADAVMLAESIGAGAAAESGTTEDVIAENIGRRSLKKGDSLYLPLASADTTFERLVEWQIPDRFNYDGTYARGGGSAHADGELYDAIRFRNPFPGPMTAASVEICDGDSVLAQSSCEWVNPDEETILSIARAQTVSGTVVEYEINDPESLKQPSGVTTSVQKSSNQSAFVWIAGVRYRHPEVAGSLTLKNFRSRDAVFLIKLRYSGELLSAEGDPENEVIERSVYSVNKRNELTWTLTLKPGEERTLAYKYSLLVRN